MVMQKFVLTSSVELTPKKYVDLRMAVLVNLASVEEMLYENQESEKLCKGLGIYSLCSIKINQY